MAGKKDPDLNSVDALSAEDWTALDSFIGKLTRSVKLVVWANEEAAVQDRQTVGLCRTLVERYEALDLDVRPRQTGHDYHPIIGLMGFDEDGQEIDYRLRLIGHPAGYQINSLVGCIQAISFRGQTLEPVTRIKLSKLAEPVLVQVFTSPENEAGVGMATLAANLAVASEHIGAQVVLVNQFPDLIVRYSVYTVPHTVINDRHHLQGVFSEEKFLELLARALRLSRKSE